MFVNLNDTFELLEDQRIDPLKDKASKNNRITGYPKGILIEDTYNNPFFPIQPIPKIDNGNFSLKLIYSRFLELYSKEKSQYLPWHYTIGLMKTDYYIFNTRPIDLKFPKTTYETKEENNWDGITKLFFKDKIFNIEDAIHICIIGDTNSDVYTKTTYKLIGESCISPMLNYFKLGKLYSGIFGLNLGARFNMSVLEHYINR